MYWKTTKWAIFHQLPHIMRNQLQRVLCGPISLFILSCATTSCSASNFFKKISASFIHWQHTSYILAHQLPKIKIHTNLRQQANTVFQNKQRDSKWKRMTLLHPETNNIWSEKRLITMLSHRHQHTLERMTDRWHFQEVICEYTLWMLFTTLIISQLRLHKENVLVVPGKFSSWCWRYLQRKFHNLYSLARTAKSQTT